MIREKESIPDKIKALIQPGGIYFVSDFEDLGNNETVKKSLSRLHKANVLIRLYNGIYLRPHRDDLVGIVYPPIEFIAKRIAEHDMIDIKPVGSLALNMLGLSTQVPMNAVYATNGSNREISVGRRKIIFKKVSQKSFMFKNEILSLIVSAMKEIGRENIDLLTIDSIRNILKDNDNFDEYKEDLKLMPAWIRKILGQMILDN